MLRVEITYISMKKTGKLTTVDEDRWSMRIEQTDRKYIFRVHFRVETISE